MDYNIIKEGDINATIGRAKWEDNLNADTKSILKSDGAVFYKQSMSTPCMNSIKGCEGAYLIDGTGQKILDFHGNSLHQVGYKNPFVIEAIINQMNLLPFIPRRYTNQIAIDAANALINSTNSKNFKVLFTPSGSAAVGIALKIARKYTGKHKVISMWESFHGAGLDAISVGGEAVFKKDMGPMMSGSIKSIPYNAYRNIFNSNHPEVVSDKTLDYLEYVIENEGEIGAIVLEPVRATDVHIPPKCYFKRLRQICDSNDILLIFDEIPTCLGRSGKFYVHQHFDVEPDLLVLGKGLGGGIVPQAAVLIHTKLDIAEDISLGHYTHEKPAIGSAAIMGVMKAFDEQKLLENVAQMAEIAKNKMKELYDRNECIGDIRQLGLLISFELVKDRKSKEKDYLLTEQILYHSLSRGLSFKTSSGNCITWHPPLIVTSEQMVFAFNIFEEAINLYSNFTKQYF